MSTRVATGAPPLLARFLAVVARGQTYRNLLYLLIAFPLGTFYFVLLTSGFSVGLGLLITVVGAPLLVTLLVVTVPLAKVERWLAVHLLGVEIPVPDDPERPSGLWNRLVALLTSVRHWKGMLYLASKFFLGLFSFLLVVILGAISASLVTAPFYYADPNTQIVALAPIFDVVTPVAESTGVSLYQTPRLLVTADLVVVDTLPEALAMSLAGIALGLVSLHVCNFVARLYGAFTRFMLRGRRESGTFGTAK
ncbi:sensor domain-containing protein [Halorussus halophilus]|uniref:sensor domain-containing protein n=1 Tax=Halorussus halophilus TaxID=2650975 RepID=UPI00178843F7|nr:sensor domain-containing protein [Halorussus halophilus]